MYIYTASTAFIFRCFVDGPFSPYGWMQQQTGAIYI